MDPITLPTDWMQFITVFLVFVLTMLVQMIKALVQKVWPIVPDEVWPLVTIVISVVFCVAIGTRLGWDWLWAVCIGLIMGAAASGFYSWGTIRKGGTTTTETTQ